MYEPTLTTQVMQAFAGYLRKEASVGSAIQAGLGSGMGLGLGTGLALGGIHGAVKGYRSAREQGAGALGAAGNAVHGALGGALKGGATGALVGGGLGAAAGGMLPEKVTAATKRLAMADNKAGAFSRFGQRQVHSLTGWTPGGTAKSIESIGAGAAVPRRALENAKAVWDPKDLVRGQSALKATEKAQEMGLTSLPGIVKSVGNNGLLPTAKAGLQAGWAGSTPRMKALMVGLPAVQAAQTLRSHDDPNRPNQLGKGERVGRLLGGAVGTMAAPISLAGGLALSTALEHAGGSVGRGVDKLTHGKKVIPPQVQHEPSRPPASEPGDTGQVATERVFGTGYSGGSGGME